MQEQSFLSVFDRVPWRIFQNKSGETVPPFGVMKKTNAVTRNGEICYEIGKPDTDFQSQYLVNGHIQIENDGYGLCTWLEEAGLVLCDTINAADGEEWGVKSGQWSLTQHRSGFWIAGSGFLIGSTYHARAKQYYVTECFGKYVTASTVAKGAISAFAVWAGASGSEAATEMRIQARAKYAAVTGQKGASAAKLNGNWYAAPWEK